MKRCIKKKYAELRKSDGTAYTDNLSNKIMSIIDDHYFQTSIISKKSQSQIYETAKADICDLLKDPKVSDLLFYMNKCWYDENNWRLWGRRNETFISFSRTTMKVEAHWSLIKRLFLLPYNRPRLDLLFYILDKKILPKFVQDYNLFLSGMKRPSWWRAFVSEWKKSVLLPSRMSTRRITKTLFVHALPG